jgi:hypothetical protein
VGGRHRILLLLLAACGPPAPPAGEPVGGPPPPPPEAADAGAACVPGDEPRLTIVTGALPAGCEGGEYFIDGVASGRYPVTCAPAPAGTHNVRVSSHGDCAGMGDCDLTFEPGRETVHDLRNGCPERVATAPAPEADCATRYQRGFRVDLGRGVEELRAVANPHWGTATSLNSYGNPCATLGASWHAATGSYSSDFLTRLRGNPDPDLRDALARCPVTYRNLDTVCAPCVAGSQHCPCARRDVSDWLFCTR